VRRNEVRATKERVAELLSDDVEPKAIAERLGVRPPRVYQLIGEIKQDLGWQAQ